MKVRYENIEFEDCDNVNVTGIIERIKKPYYRIKKENSSFKNSKNIEIDFWLALGHPLNVLEVKNSFRDSISFVKNEIKRKNQKIYKVLKTKNSFGYVIRIFVNGNTDYIGK